MAQPFHLDKLSVEKFLSSLAKGDIGQKCCIFAGAGISIDSGLPNFFNFGKNMIRRIIGDSEDVINDEDLQSLLLQLRPEILLQTLSSTFGERMTEFSEWLLGETPNPTHVFIARALHRGHLVITTNLDRLIELAYQAEFGEMPRVVAKAEDFRTLAGELARDGRPSCPTVVKPHGTIDTRFQEPCRRYETVRTCIDQVGQGLTADCREVLTSYLTSGPAVFLGYSGCDHFSITPLLRIVGLHQPAIWMFFEPHDHSLDRQNNPMFANLIVDEHGPVRATHEELLGQIYSGKVYADIPRGMELHAVCDILLARRDNIFQWRGDVSRFFRHVTEKEDFQPPPAIDFVPPAWVKGVSEFEKHLMACNLHKKANFQTKSLASAEKALKLSEDRPELSADIKFKIAEIEMEKSTPESTARSQKLLEDCVAAYKSVNNRQSMNESSLEIVNVLRRTRNFKEALQLVDRIEKTLTDTEPYDGIKKHLIRVLQMRGLILGLSGDKEILDQEKSIGFLKSAVEISAENGFVLLKSSCLNALGLVLFQQAGDSVERLTEAEECLYNALDLNVYCGQSRSCFQQYRNLGLVHSKMAAMESDPTKQKRLHEKSLEDFVNAENYLQRSVAGFMEGEVLEAKFRQAEALVKLGRYDEVVDKCRYLISRRQHFNDWHNEARTIDLILRTSQANHYGQWMGRLLDIYYSVLSSDAKLKLFKAQAFRYANAKDIFSNAIHKAISTGYDGLATDLKACLNKLDDIVNQSAATV